MSGFTHDAASGSTPSEAVSEADVTELLEAAMAAPSAGNQQPWHFIVIRDRAVLNAIPGFHPHAAMALHAPVGILVCGDPALEKHPGYWVQDCAAATENLLLAVAAKGLGAVWCGVYPSRTGSKASPGCWASRPP